LRNMSGFRSKTLDITIQKRYNVFMTNEKIRLPSKSFIRKLKNLTAENRHGECYYEIANWCYDNSILSDKGIEAIQTFRMFADIFKTLAFTHTIIGHMPFWEMRYNIGNEMDKYIKNWFGEKTLNELLKGQC